MNRTVEEVRKVRIVGQSGSGRHAEDDPKASQSVRGRLLQLAYRFLWDRHAAEDVVQDALAAAHRREADLRDGDKWWSWVCRIVIRRCHLHARSRLLWRRHRGPYRAEVIRRPRESTVADSTGLKELVRCLLSELPRRQHEVIVLRHLQGMTYEEIGEVLGVSPSTARVHAQAGRETLRKLMLERQPEAFAHPATSSGDQR